MGIEKDFLMRQLLMLIEVIHKILRLRKRGRLDEAEEQIDYFYECLKIDKEVTEFDIERLISFLEDEKQLTNEQLELVAFVIKEQGELAQDVRKQKELFHKSYFLLDKVERESVSFSMNRQMKLAELRAYLN